METLETKRLLLRPWRESDLADFYAYAKDPEVGPNAGWKPHESMEESRKILRSFMEGGEVRALEWKESGKAVGSLGLHGDRAFPERKDFGKELGYVLSRDYWGRGLMTEAVKGILPFVFGTMKLDYLSVAHFLWNMRSKRVIEKCGFRYIKTKKGSFTDYRGEKLDEVCYLMMREEYITDAKTSFHTGILTRGQAAETCGWRYSDRYAAYDSPDWKTALAQKWDFTDDEKRNRWFLAILDESGTFCGYFRLSPDDGAVTLGLEMKPDYCGRGYGRKIMELILKAFREKHPGKTLELDVRSWNSRAVACYRNAGFVETGRFRKRTPLGEDSFIRMRYQESEMSF